MDLEIVCTKPCIHQKNGVCRMQIAGAVCASDPVLADADCVHYHPITADLPKRDSTGTRVEFYY